MDRRLLSPPGGKIRHCLPRGCETSLRPRTRFGPLNSIYVYSWPCDEVAPGRLRAIQTCARSTLARTGGRNAREPGEHGDLPRRRSAVPVRRCAKRGPLAAKPAGPGSSALGCAHGGLPRNRCARPHHFHRSSESIWFRRIQVNPNASPIAPLPRQGQFKQRNTRPMMLALQRGPRQSWQTGCLATMEQEKSALVSIGGCIERFRPTGATSPGSNALSHPKGRSWRPCCQWPERWARADTSLRRRRSPAGPISPNISRVFKGFQELIPQLCCSKTWQNIPNRLLCSRLILLRRFEGKCRSRYFTEWIRTDYWKQF